MTVAHGSIVLMIGAAVAVAALGQSDQPAIAGLDHVPIAVGDLDAAAARYRALGFSLKPGRPHANGIRNQHVKFPDGTELELITAPSAQDALTTAYRDHLAHGDGPAFLAFYAPDRSALMRTFDAAGIHYRNQGPYVDLPPGGPLSYIFFGGRNQSPTDRPEHFAHANGASSLIAVWIAGDDLSGERRVLEAGGAQLGARQVHVPEPVEARVARLGEGEVLLLPRSRQLVAMRRIVGATLLVRSLAVARRALRSFRDSGVVVQGTSVFVPPAVAHGLWLELREGRH